MATHYETAPEDRIPLGQKIAFGIGMLGNQMFPAALSIFMVVLVKGLGMSPLLWGILFLIPGSTQTLHIHRVDYYRVEFYRHVATLSGQFPAV